MGERANNALPLSTCNTLSAIHGCLLDLHHEPRRILMAGYIHNKYMYHN